MGGPGSGRRPGGARKGKGMSKSSTGPKSKNSRWTAYDVVGRKYKVPKLKSKVNSGIVSGPASRRNMAG